MALGSSDLSLLFQLRAQNQTGPAFKSVQADAAQLKAKFGSEFGQMSQVATTSLGQVTQSLVQVSGQLPIVGNAVSGLSSQFSSIAGTATSAATGVSSIAPPLAAAAIAMGITFQAALALGQGLFSLAQAAAEYRGKMFDMSQQTGVAVETLSTLEIAAKNTGGSIESISQALVIFQGNLDEAQDSSSKMGTKFKELGISTNNTEEAFRDALFQLSKMPEGFEQTNEASELFGRRGGKQVLAILKELGGDLDGATAKFKQLGLVISEEDAKAADEFNDQLALVNFQFRALLGKEGIPAALLLLKELSNLFTENREAISAFSQIVGALTYGVFGPLIDQIRAVNAALRAMQSAVEFLDDLRGFERPALPGAVAGVGGVNALAGLTGGAGGVERAAAARTTRAGGKSEAQIELEKQAAAVNRLTSELAKVVDEYSGVNTATREYAVNQEILNGALKKAAPGLQELALGIARNTDEIKKQIALNKQLKDFQDQQNEAVKLAIEGEDNFFEAAERVIKSLEEQGKQLSVAEIFWLKFNAAILTSVSSMERAIEVEQQLRDAQLVPLAGGVEGDGSVLPGFDEELGLPPPNDEVFDAWKDAFEELKDIGAGAMADLAFGVGDLVQQWVLMGTIGPNAIRKMTASVLAGVAAQAAIKAVYELAAGFAALFLNPAEAAAHFTSAAIFGSIAGGTALAGRAIAGDAFSQPNKPTGSTRSAGGGSSSTSGSTAIERDRKGAGQSQAIEQTLMFKVKGDAVVDHFVQDYRLNGLTRVIITSDGQ